MTVMPTEMGRSIKEEILFYLSTVLLYTDKHYNQKTRRVCQKKMNKKKKDRKREKEGEIERNEEK